LKQQLVQEIQEAVQKPDGSYSILNNVTSLWPDAIYEQLEEADTSHAGVEILRKDYQAKREEKQRKKIPTTPIAMETSLSRRSSYDPLCSESSEDLRSTSRSKTDKLTSTASIKPRNTDVIRTSEGDDDDSSTDSGMNLRPLSESSSSSLEPVSFYWS